MATISKFIGVDKYSDPDIRELFGATRDAKSLWALFTDNISDAQTELILDEQATVDKVSSVIEECKNAREEDNVILYFSGHGSPDHRLALHNTKISDLENTSLPMDLIADLFTSSKAKNIICILDCCFSGGAPAKVLDMAPAPRSLSHPQSTITGEGRLIFTASSKDEPSFEIPKDRQGVFTSALVESMLELGKEDQIPFPVLIDKVMEVVRTKSALIGVTQTPELFGSIKGGFNLPSIAVGDKFREIFPTIDRFKVSADIGDLSGYDIPEELIDLWKEKFPDGLNELQLMAVNDYGVLNDEDIFVIAPTSTGKTFIGELATVKAILAGKKAVFLLPYRALTSQKYQDFEKIYGERLGYRVIRCTGDRLDQTGSFIKGKYDVALLTYEMFLGLAVRNSYAISGIGSVVVDEAHFITDESRGIVVELILTYLGLAKDRGVSPQLILLSAVVGDTNGFEDWLDTNLLKSTKRPVPLMEGVFDRTGRFVYLDPVTKEKKYEQFLPSSEIVQRRSKPGSQDMIVPLVKKLVSDEEKVIIFRNTRGTTKGSAKYLADELNLTEATEALSGLPVGDPSTASRALNYCLSQGTAFHNSDLSRIEREVVEKAFNTEKISALSATTTLSAGVNTPASSVILAETFFYTNDGRKPFTVAEYKNMVGRAGRLGYNEKGKSFLLANNTLEQEQLYNSYVNGDLESIGSSFRDDDLDNWVIKLLAQVNEIKREEVSDLLLRTFGGFLAVKVDPDWSKNIRIKIEGILVELINTNLVDDENGVLRLTPLGAACANSVFSIRSAMRLVSAFSQLKSANIDSIDLMHLVQGIQESDEAYTPMFKSGSSELSWVQIARSTIKTEVFSYLQRNVPRGNTFSVPARYKRSLILTDWIGGVPTETIEARFTKNTFFGSVGRGDITSIADRTRFHLRSAYDISVYILENGGIDGEEVEKLIQRLELGLPSDLVGLTSLPFSLSRGEYLILKRAGITTEPELLAREENSLPGELEDETLQLIKKHKEGA